MTSDSMPPSEAVPPEASMKPEILIVDDDPRNLLALEALLEGGDYTLVKAQTSDEALLALMNGEFAAIILDVKMPGVSGIELARLIKQRRRTRHVPIIFLTAHYLEDEHVMMAYDVGAVDYLTKPINSAVLRSKVNVFVDLFRKTRALAALNDKLETQNILLKREAEERARRIVAEAARAEAEAANEAKDRFLAMLSHELRTPLTPIVYAVDMLGMDENCPPQIREALDVIQRNVWVETRLIDDLLDLARIRSGKLVLNPGAADVHEVLREAIKIGAADAAARNIHIREYLQATVTRLNGDAARLQQIFWNLLSNAVKFTPDGGTITVRTSDASDAIMVEINDTGIGIEPAKIDRIFDAFEQGQRNGSPGLGLGLAISKALVDLHGGTIKVRSDGPGLGTTFVVELPIEEAAHVEQPAPVGELPTTTGQRVLLVDDHNDTAQVLGRLLSRLGYRVRTADSITQAMKVADDYEFDILISDIGLPDGRGTELLERLQVSAGHPIRAVAMSGFGMESDLESSRRAGFAEHLTKPVEFGALRQALARLSVMEPAAAAGN
ncbi:MAG: ATP-binding response regulator [Chthoniobacterales bacterium]